MKPNVSSSQQSAAAAYNVPNTALQGQCAKPTSADHIHHKASKLQGNETGANAKYRSMSNTRGFALTLSYVREMANQHVGVAKLEKAGPPGPYVKGPEIICQVMEQMAAGKSHAATDVLLILGLV